LAEARVGFEGVRPILRVESLPKSIEYYVPVLGFHIDWQTPLVACVSRDRCAIFLREQDQGNRGVLRMGSEPLAGEPTGHWHDMRGDLWAPRPAGGWTRVD
jgi:hypothetical protein